MKELGWKIADWWDSVMESRTKYTMLCIFVGFVVGLSIPAFALEFSKGQTLRHQLSVCLKKQDAIDIVNTDAQKGFDEAAKVWNDKEGCMTVPVVGLRVGNIVHSAQVKRSGSDKTARVVELIDDTDSVVGYFLTTETVKIATAWRGSQS